MATTIKIKRKNFGIGASLANTWKSGALGKAKIIGGATAAAGIGAAGVGAAKFAGASKDALKGEMGED